MRLLFGSALLAGFTGEDFDAIWLRVITTPTDKKTAGRLVSSDQSRNEHERIKNVRSHQDRR
jgi:hypothetical protein